MPGHFAERHGLIVIIALGESIVAIAVVLLILVPVAIEVPAIVALATANVLLWAMIAYETRLYGESRHAVRRPGTAEA